MYVSDACKLFITCKYANANIQLINGDGNYNNNVPSGDCMQKEEDVNGKYFEAASLTFQYRNHDRVM